MKSLIVFLAIIGFALSACVDSRAEFINFKTSFARKYNSSSDEEKKYGVFRKNLEEIEEHNKRYEAGLETYYKGVDQFTDMTTEEFEGFLTEKQLPAEMYNNITHYQPPARASVPASVDYRNRRACNPPTNQGDCGSCWAHAAVGCLASHIFLKTGKLPRLSYKYLIKCDTEFNEGCNGGNTAVAIDNLAKNGVVAEDDYNNGLRCRTKTKKVAGFTGSKMVYPFTEESLELAVATAGPVAVSVDSTEWSGYKWGIFQARRRDVKTDHAVIIDGYGVENGIKYWLLRNSWGTHWGEKGYIRIRKGINQIGIAEYGKFPEFST